MTSLLDHIEADDGADVDPEQIPVALTAGALLFENGATRVFGTDGTTTYTEHGRPSEGTWYVEGRSFCSFWPPNYTGCYHITWLVEAGHIAGLRLDDLTNPSLFIGRYHGPNNEEKLVDA